MAKSYWKVRKGVYSGISSTGKRWMGKMSAEEARKKAGGSRSSSSKSKTKTSKKSSKRKTNLTKKGKRGSRKFTLPLAPIAAIAAVVAKPAKMAVDGDYEGAAAELGARVVGFNFQSGEMDLMYAAKNCWLPLVIGGAIHKFVGGPPLNLNRMLASANVPIIRI